MPLLPDAPVVVMDERTLGDVELALLGVLAGRQHLGAAVAAQPGDEGEPLLGVPEGVAEAALAAGRLTLVDQESTPLATLTDVADSTHTVPGGRVLSGRLVAERERESGAARASRLSRADLGGRWSHVVVVARPLTLADRLPEAADGPVLLVVPDDSSATDGVPTSVMMRLAERAAAGHGHAEVRSAPLRWRDPASDRELVSRLAAALGGVPALLLRADESGANSGDQHAADWATARRHLGSAVDTTPAPSVTADTWGVLARWLPPRPRRGLVVMCTGLSGSGKSTLARALRDRLEDQTERTVSLLDGDVVRQLLSSGLGFDRASRITNVRRIGYVATEVARHGGIAICAPIAPYESVRADVRRMVETVGDFVLVHVSTPLSVCEARDLKGLYAAARAGRIPEFSGISDPYDVPDNADVTVDTSTTSIEDGTDTVFRYLADGGWLKGLT